jgi:hypothetical protein
MPDDAALVKSSQPHKKEMKEEAGEPAPDKADGEVAKANITGLRLHLIMAAFVPSLAAVVFLQSLICDS